MFTHLHVHSSYSLKDGIQPAEEIGATVAKRGMTSVALSDHGYMGGIPKFVAGCRAAGVKPIIGNEMYLAHGNAQDHEDFFLEDNANRLSQPLQANRVQLRQGFS
jgi:DNA polymerase-3 subunit alpha